MSLEFTLIKKGFGNFPLLLNNCGIPPTGVILREIREASIPFSFSQGPLSWLSQSGLWKKCSSLLSGTDRAALPLTVFAHTLCVPVPRGGRLNSSTASVK